MLIKHGACLSALLPASFVEPKATEVTVGHISPLVSLW